MPRNRFVMNFYDIYTEYARLDLNKSFEKVQDEDVKKALSSCKPCISQLLTLLSPKAEDYLESLARRAHELTLQNFGRTIQLYTPMYVSNYCDSWCVYCGFNARNDIERKKLTIEEVEKEAKVIASWGLKHILLLCGESRDMAPVSYIKDCVKELRRYFDSVSIEIYALSEDEYKELIGVGVDGLVIYQELYDEEIYKRLHPKGPKKDYLFRLEAPFRAAKQLMRTVNIGVLLGLNDWRKEIFFTALHAQYLQDSFPSCEISVSIPRIRPQVGGFVPSWDVTDKNIVQIITALRLFMPRLGITLSTRERASFRENLISLGITKMSAGSTTIVGGHTLARAADTKSAQFEISDDRSVDEIRRMISLKGYQPVLKDWVRC